MSVREALRSRNVPFVTLLHRPVPSAARLAQSLHVAGDRVAKSVLVRTERGFVLAVIPATHRVDLETLGLALQAREVRLATEDELEILFHDCERGAAPPLGHLYGLTTIVDAELALQPEIVFLGNTRHEAIRLRFGDYDSFEQPLHAAFARPIHTPRRVRLRRAG